LLILAAHYDKAFKELKQFDIKSDTGAFVSLVVQGGSQTVYPAHTNSPEPISDSLNSCVEPFETPETSFCEVKCKVAQNK